MEALPLQGIQDARNHHHLQMLNSMSRQEDLHAHGVLQSQVEF